MKARPRAGDLTARFLRLVSTFPAVAGASAPLGCLRVRGLAQNETAVRRRYAAAQLGPGLTAPAHPFRISLAPRPLRPSLASHRSLTVETMPCRRRDRGR